MFIGCSEIKNNINEIKDSLEIIYALISSYHCIQSKVGCNMNNSANLFIFFLETSKCAHKITYLYRIL